MSSLEYDSIKNAPTYEALKKRAETENKHIDSIMEEEWKKDYLCKSKDGKMWLSQNPALIHWQHDKSGHGAIIYRRPPKIFRESKKEKSEAENNLW